MDNLTKQTERREEEIRQQTVTEEKQVTAIPTAAFLEMETWNLAEGEKVEDRKQKYLEEALAKQDIINQRFIEKGFVEVNETEVKETAQVTNPPVQEPAVRETAKQRSERARKERTARRKCPVGDADTIDINRSITALNKSKLNSVRNAGATNERAATVRADTRMIRVFCKGYKKDWKGQPATEADRRAMNEDRRWLDDYLSGDAQRRKPHLDRITNEILSFRFTPEMLTTENFIKNASKLKEMADKLMYFENLYNENEQYFKSLPQVEQDIIEANKAITGIFCTQVTNLAGTKGIEINSGDIYGHAQKNGIKAAQEYVGPMGEVFNKACRTFDDDYEKAIDKEIERQKTKILQQYKELDDEYRKEEKYVDINFTLPAPEAIRGNITNIRKTIGKNQSKYQENKDLTDKLYTEFFKINDIMIENAATSRAIQEGCQDYEKYYKSNSYKKKIAVKFLERQDMIEAQKTEIQERAAGIKNVMEHLLKGTELNDVGKEILREFSM